MYRAADGAYRRQPIPFRELHDPLGVREPDRQGRKNKRLRTTAQDRCKRRVQVGRAAHVDPLQFQAKLACNGILQGELRHQARVRQVRQDGHAFDPGRDFREEVQLLRQDQRAEDRQPRDVSSRSCQGLHQARRNGIGHERHDDRNRIGRLLGGKRGGGSVGDKDIHLQMNKLPGKSRQSLALSRRTPAFDPYAPALVVTPVAQCLLEGIFSVKGFGARGLGQEPDRGHALGLLRVGQRRSQTEEQAERLLSLTMSSFP